MTTLLRRRAIRLAATAALAAAAFASVASPAIAAGSEIRFSAHGDGYDGMYTATDPARSAGFDIVTVGSTEVGVYCLEMNRPMDTEGTFSFAPLTDSASANQRTAAWLAVNHASVGTPAADPNDEAAATQLAIWHYTDGIAVEIATTPRQSVVDRANELISAAAGQSLVSGPVGAVISTEAAETAPGEAVVQIVVSDTTGAPYAGQNVTVTVDGGAAQSVTTGADGRATATVAAAPGATVTAAWLGLAPAGSLLVPDTAGKQLVVTDTDAPVAAVASATVTAAPAPGPGPDPAPTPPPATPVAGGELPYTGSWLGPDQLVLGLVLLTAAGGIAVTMWRRRLA
jgi:TQXA domain-containing protein